MSNILTIIGVLTIIILPFIGVFSGSLQGIIIGIVGGITSGVIYIALAKILENQSIIIHNILNETNKKTLLFKDQMVCSDCNKEYDSNYKSCPYCGHKEA